VRQVIGYERRYNLMGNAIGSQEFAKCSQGRLSRDNTHRKILFVRSNPICVHFLLLAHREKNRICDPTMTSCLYINKSTSDGGAYKVRIAPQVLAVRLTQSRHRQRLLRLALILVHFGNL
jgi:hypothetical protein